MDMIAKGVGMRQRGTSLRTRLMLLVLVAVLPAFGIITYTAFEQRRLAGEHAQQDALRLARLSAQELALVVTGTRQLLINLAHFPLIQQRDALHCRHVLRELIQPQPQYTNLAVADAHGQVWCSATALAAPLNVGDLQFYRRALDTGSFAVGELRAGRIPGNPSLGFGYPVARTAQTNRSVVFAALDLAWLHRLAARNELPPDATLTITDSAGTILVRAPESGTVGRPLVETPYYHAEIARGAENTFTAPGFDGINRLYAYTRVSENDVAALTVTIAIPEHLAYAAADRLFVRNLSLLVLFAAAVLVIAWFASDAFVLRRVRALSDAIHRLAGGNFSARSGLAHAPEELGRLAQQFDRMAETLQQHEASLQAAGHESNRANRALMTLSTANGALLRAEDEPTLLGDICRTIIDIGGYRLVCVAYPAADNAAQAKIVTAVGAEPDLAASVSTLWSDQDGPGGPMDFTLRTARPVIVDNTQTDPDFAPWRAQAQRHGLAAAVSLPLRTGGEMIGVLSIFSAEVDAFDDTELTLLTELADDLAFGIATVRTRRKHRDAEATIQHMAFFDALTGLPNHLHLVQTVQRAIDKAAQERTCLAVLAINIDRFKEINDTLGFEQGDALLMAVAPRLRQALGESAFIARIHGDAFGALLQNSSAELAENAARHAQEAMKAPFMVDQLALDTPVTIGIALYPAHGDRPEKLIRRADVAVRHARRRSQGQMFYTTGWEQQNPRRLALASELRRAIENGLLELHYQPKVDLRSGRVCGLEALARWQHPQHGAIRPDEFTRIAEHTGLIHPLAYWSLDAALRQMKDWRATGITLPIAVNLSARNLHDPSLPDRTQSLLTKYNVEPGSLEIEITESAIMEDPEHIAYLLAYLHELGIRLFIDDFGTGYSSLSYLKNLPVDVLKIDKSFTRDMLTDRGSDLIVRSTIELAHNLNLKVCAEGVETQEMLEHLNRLECDSAQGYLIARPVPPNHLPEWLLESPWMRAAPV
jgi:diguanylate cyclase